MYAGVRGQSDSGNGVEAVTQKGTAMRAHADAGGTGAYVSAEVDPATGTPGLPLLVEATRVGVTQLPVAARFVGHVEIAGDLIVVGGAKSAAAAGPDGAHLRVYCTEMPEAWIEDAGEAELVDGVAEVAIDERLAAIADTGDYQVFLSPYAPVHAYVARRDAGSFEIRLHGEKHHRSVACGWRLHGPPQRHHGRAVRAVHAGRGHRHGHRQCAARSDPPRAPAVRAPPAGRDARAGDGHSRP